MTCVSYDRRACWEGWDGVDGTTMRQCGKVEMLQRAFVSVLNEG